MIAAVLGLEEELEGGLEELGARGGTLGSNVMLFFIMFLTAVRSPRSFSSSSSLDNSKWREEIDPSDSAALASSASICFRFFFLSDCNRCSSVLDHELSSFLKLSFHW